MTYSNTSKVMHLNNVADTGRNIVTYARALGRTWSLRELPAGVGSVPSIVSRRATDAMKWALAGPHPDLMHIHYAPNGYYGWLKRGPYVLHLHGTDLRQDLHRPLVGALTREAIKHAAIVIAATPDLLSPLQKLRNDAVYIPNALPHQLLGLSPTAPVPNRVVFGARWDESKGGLPVVQAARELVRSGFDVVGVNWGPYAVKAAEAGVDVRPLLPKAEYQQLLASASVVVGQFRHDLLTISDLEALALERPLVTRTVSASAPVVTAVPSQIATKVRELLDDPAAARTIGIKSRAWALAHHHPDITLGRLEAVYREILG